MKTNSHHRLISGKKIFPLLLLLTSLLQAGLPIETDKAIFLFNQGETQMIASMLRYAEQHDETRLASLNFRIVFMGSVVSEMMREPFCHFPEKLIHYKDLGVEEEIDNKWPRAKRISDISLKALIGNLSVREKIWTGVSTDIFWQVLVSYQNMGIEGTALRDNPFFSGESDYFHQAMMVQYGADNVLVPSEDANIKLGHNKCVSVIGHAPTEDWVEKAQKLDRLSIMKKLNLDRSRPVVVLCGSYGGQYESRLRAFIELLSESSVQIICVPHPQGKGMLEQEICPDWVVSCDTIEAIAIADLVVTTDPTSTIVIQARALGKPVSITQYLEEPRNPFPDVFSQMGMPRGSALLLWNAFLKAP